MTSVPDLSTIEEAGCFELRQMKHQETHYSLVAKKLKAYGADRYNSFPDDEHIVSFAHRPVQAGDLQVIAHAGRYGVMHWVTHTNWPPLLQSDELPNIYVRFFNPEHGNAPVGTKVDPNLAFVGWYEKGYRSNDIRVIHGTIGHEHEWVRAKKGNAYHEARCTVCDYAFGVDSSG